MAFYSVLEINSGGQVDYEVRLTPSSFRLQRVKTDLFKPQLDF